MRGNTISGLASELVKDGLLVRQRGSKDGRAVRFYLGAGVEAQRLARLDRRSHVLEDALADLDAGDRATIVAAITPLERLADGLARQVGEVLPSGEIR